MSSIDHYAHPSLALYSAAPEMTMLEWRGIVTALIGQRQPELLRRLVAALANVEGGPPLAVYAHLMEVWRPPGLDRMVDEQRSYLQTHHPNWLARMEELYRAAELEEAAARAWSLFTLWAQMETDAWMAEVRGR